MKQNGLRMTAKEKRREEKAKGKGERRGEEGGREVIVICGAGIKGGVGLRRGRWRWKAQDEEG